MNEKWCDCGGIWYKIDGDYAYWKCDAHNKVGCVNIKLKMPAEIIHNNPKSYVDLVEKTYGKL